jgi:hypothetical protein
VLSVGGFNKFLNGPEDWDLCLRLAQEGCKMEWVPEIVSAYRVHSGQSVRNASRLKNESLKVLDSFFFQPGLLESLNEHRNKAYASIYISSAFQEIVAGEYLEAQHDLEEAIHLNPDLLTGDPLHILMIAIFWAAHPLTGDPTEYILRFLDHLPSPLEFLKTAKDDLILSAVIKASFNVFVVDNRVLLRTILISGVKHNSAISDDRFVSILSDSIVYICGDDLQTALDILNKFMRELIPEYAYLCRLEQKVRGRLWIINAFNERNKGNTLNSAKAAISGVFYDPTLLQNRGVWSLMALPIKRIFHMG